MMESMNRARHLGTDSDQQEDDTLQSMATHNRVHVIQNTIGIQPIIKSIIYCFCI